MRQIPYSLLSGIMAIALFFTPFANTVTYAAEGENVRDDNYDVRSDNYDEDDYYEGYEDGLDYGDIDGYENAYYGDDRNPNAEDHLDGDEELGYTLGFKDGYEIGYERGYLEGLEDYDPYKAGYLDGDSDGFARGYDDGYEGKQKDDSFDLDGDFDEEYKNGYTDGYTDGYGEGYQRGKESKEGDESGIYSEGKDTVTGETYYNYTLDSNTVKKYQDKDGNLKTEKTNSINLDEDAIKAIKNQATFETANGTLIKFPKSALEQVLKIAEQYKEEGDHREIDLGFYNITNQYSDALSEAIDFYITSSRSNSESGTLSAFEGKLDTPITVSFFVDKDKVKNWKDLTLIYVDENGKETNYANQVKSINPETGEVVVEINYFKTFYSTYYIAEVKGEGAGPGGSEKPEDSNDDKDDSSDANKIEDSVTGETYYNYQLDGNTVKKYQDKDGNLKTKKTNSINLDKGAIKTIKKQAIFETSNGTSIKFPKAALEQILNHDESNSEGVYFKFNNVTNQYKNSLSEAIQFYISNDDGSFKGDLDTPITVSFFVDKDKVKNWADLTLIYVDDNGKETNYANQVKSINPETGEVVVEINHFSTYYIAEVAGKGAGSDVIVKPGQGGSDDGGLTNGQSGSGNGDVKVSVEDGSEGQGATDTDGQTLPNTATNSYNLLLAGALSLALGLGAIVLYRRKKAL